MSKRTLTGLLAACFSIGLVYAEDFERFFADWGTRRAVVPPCTWICPSM